jgi:hypothetical protein
MTDRWPLLGIIVVFGTSAACPTSRCRFLSHGKLHAIAEHAMLFYGMGSQLRNLWITSDLDMIDRWPLLGLIVVVRMFLPRSQFTGFMAPCMSSECFN